MTALIRRIWKIPWAMWQVRNAELHKHDLDNILDSLRDQVQGQLDRGHQDIPELQHWFSDFELASLQTTRNQAYLRMWLKHVKAARKFAEMRQESDQTLARMQAFMRAFVRPTGTTG
jgi:hypothetical protein